MLKYTTVFSIFLLWACTPTEKASKKHVKNKPEKAIVKTHNKPTSPGQLKTKEPIKKNLTPKRLLKNEPSNLIAEKKTSEYIYRHLRIQKSILKPMGGAFRE